MKRPVSAPAEGLILLVSPRRSMTHSWRIFRRRSPGLTALILFASSLGVGAQSTEEADPTPGPIVTDRPTDSASPTLVPGHTFQLELGYKLSRLDKGSTHSYTRVFPDLLARYGVHRKVEARLVAAGWSFESGDGPGNDGFSDISVGTKIALAAERGRRPQSSLLVDVSLPVGQGDVTSDYVIPKVLYLGSNTLSDRLSLTYNVGPSLVTMDSDGGSDTSVDLNYAIALSRSVRGPFSLFGELYGGFALGSDRLDRHSLQLGTTILLSPRFQIDVRAGAGLVRNEPDWLVGAGLAFRLPH